MPRHKREALLQSINALIENHGHSHAELLKGLQQVRSDLETATKQRRFEDFARIALQLATWIKFLIDLLHPPNDSR